MRTVVIAFFTLFVVLGCQNESQKVSRQKNIYFSVSDVPRSELEREISKTMEIQHISTPGKAMVYLLDRTIAFLPQVDAMVNQAAIQAGVHPPPRSPLDEADAKIKVARDVRSLLDAREAIARIENENSQ